MTTLSLCMIVRDEADVLPKFLRGIEGLFDQFVAVDTGSIDGTVDLLYTAGAEIHHLAWQNDFSLARNESLRHARCEWTLVLDADEFVLPGFREEIRAMIRDIRLGAADITLHSEQKNGIVRIEKLLRVFRNDTSPRYRGRIHEDITQDIAAMLTKTGKKHWQLSSPIRHVGYLQARMDAKAKQARDSKLLTLAIANEPNDLYFRYRLLELYRFWEKPEEMAGIALECRSLIERGITITPPYIAGDLVEMIRMSLYPERPEQGIEFLLSMAPFAAHTGHYHISLGGQYEKLQQLEASMQHFIEALSRVADDPARQLVETRALTGLTRLSMRGGDFVSAREFIQAAAAVSPNDPEVRMAIDFLGKQ